MRLLVANPSGDGYSQFANNTSGGGAVGSAGGSGLIFYGYTGSVGSETYAERARIDSSGKLLVGTTSTSSNATIQATNTNNPAFALNRSNAGGIVYFYFNSSNFSAATVGEIAISSTGTAYNTTSDYRLKENVAPMTGALQTVAALKPCTYTWKADGSAGQGFIAHELQAVVPDCVTGEKDAVEIVDDLDAEGKKIGTKEVPRYQGVDTSFLVATLVAAIQELKADFDAYKATHP
jgi:hypothetical protein